MMPTFPPPLLDIPGSASEQFAPESDVPRAHPRVLELRSEAHPRPIIANSSACWRWHWARAEGGSQELGEEVAVLDWP